jgi:hypothetical protein
MARQQRAASTPETVKLVSPDGEITREVGVGSKEEIGLRFDGYLPPEQNKLEAPEKPTPAEADSATTVGTNA